MKTIKEGAHRTLGDDAETTAVVSEILSDLA